MERKDWSEVIVDGCHWSRSQNLNAWDVFWMNWIQMRQCCRKIANGRRVAGDIRSLVIARDLKLEWD